MLGKFPRLKVAVSASLVALVSAAGIYLYWAWHHPLNAQAEVYVVEPGTSLRGLARELYRRGVLSEPYTLTWLGYITGRSRQLKAGEYRFPAGISAAELIDQVVAGRVIKYSLVFPEGWNFRQVMGAVRAAPKLTSTLDGLTPAQIMAHLGHPHLHPEGRFFPDTYYYSKGHTDAQILSSAFDKMQTALQQAWNERAPALPLKSKDEALVLASIIEKETARADERPMIAGVFVNRLRKGMRLQSDPTVIYGLGAAFDGNLRLRDLHTDTPYNTYTRRGLPPTPIAMPGRDSLVAALHPAETSALYFVARGDGSHVFSATLEAHSAAVAKYQLGGNAGGAKARRGEADPRGNGSKHE
jgi:UPF0755 protein